MESSLGILISAILVTTLCSGSLDDFEIFTTEPTAAEEPSLETEAKALPTKPLEKIGSSKHNAAVRTEVQTIYKVRLHALIPDLETLRLFWSRNAKEQKRPARIEFGPDEEILVRYEFEPHNSISYLDDWGRGFLLVDFGKNDLGETHNVYYSHGSFYTRNDSSSHPLPVSNENFMQIFPIDNIWNTPETLHYDSPQIRITYTDLKILAFEIDSYKNSKIGEEIGLFSNQSNQLLLKNEKSTYVLVGHVTILTREVEGKDNRPNDGTYHYGNVTESTHHTYIRYDRNRRVFYTEKNELLKDTYLVRPSVYVIKKTCTYFRNFLSSWFNQRGYC